ncbi:MAG: peptidase S8, partial [Gammaproteobacteria bacterium]|nr:peptidase S8 [Gemmatimonadota bacterium]NIU72160.1 peptidase S8 [Gammaproteobacteria bacterium]
HHDFRDPGGGTRLLGLWDQTVTVSGDTPQGYGYGTYCDPSELEAATCRQQDVNGHGTHVAGSAAGDGSATG